MKCANHEQKQAIGTCVGCGKFICEECNTEVNGKNYCKKCIVEIMSDKTKQIERMEENNKMPTGGQVSPMVFMNSGGGGGSSSSSSSSSSATAGAERRGMYPQQNILIHIVLAVLTAGVGNVVYYLYIKNKQMQWYNN